MACSGITLPLLPVTVAVRSEAWVLAGWLLGSWIRIPLQGMDVFPRLSVLCCPVYVEALRRADHSLITHPRSPTICLNSSRNLLYVRRPRSFKDCTATGKKWFKHSEKAPHHPYKCRSKYLCYCTIIEELYSIPRLTKMHMKFRNKWHAEFCSWKQVVAYIEYRIVTDL
jgi:hypothetical protein